MTEYKLTYQENNEVSELGTFQYQEELNRLIESEARLIEDESIMSVYDQMALVHSLKTWASSQYDPNASKVFRFTYPDSKTVGTWTIEEA